MTTASVSRAGPAPHVALLTLENVSKLGALDRRMREQLSAHWLDIGDDASVRAVVLTGSGRGFSTGLDLEEADAGDDPATEFANATELPRFGLGPLEHDVWKPFIVAVNGICAGGGFHLLSDADIVIASSDATFLDPHVSVGQVAALEPIALSRRIPLGSVLRMLVLGRHEALNADDALRLGLVSEIVEPERLIARAIELASFAAQGSPAAIERSKRAGVGEPPTRLGCRTPVRLGTDPGALGPSGLSRRDWCVCGATRAQVGDLTSDCRRAPELLSGRDAHDRRSGPRCLDCPTRNNSPRRSHESLSDCVVDQPNQRSGRRTQEEARVRRAAANGALPECDAVARVAARRGYQGNHLGRGTALHAPVRLIEVVHGGRRPGRRRVPGLGLQVLP